MNIFTDQQFEHFLETYRKGLGTPVASIDSEDNKKILDVLEWMSHYDEYYAVINLRDKKVAWHHGIDKHLGYQATDINKQIAFFRDIIHPFVRQWQNLLTANALHIFREDATIDVNRLSTRYIVNLPVRKQNGTYVLVKQMLLPFQQDAEGNVVSYLNVYSIVNGYRGQSLRPRFFEKNVRQDQLEDKHIERAAKEIDMKKTENFTKAQFHFINQYLKLVTRDEKLETPLNPAPRKKNQQKYTWKDVIEHTMGMTKSHVRGTIKSIQDRIRESFVTPWINSEERNGSKNFLASMDVLTEFDAAINFLHKSQILSLLKQHYINTGNDLVEDTYLF